MKVIKLYEGRSLTPLFARLERICSDPGHRFYGGLLITYPLDLPDRKRSMKWLMPAEVRVEWIREFKD